MTSGGHQTRSVFDRYNIVSEDDVREAMGKITAYVTSLPTTPTVVPPPAAVSMRTRTFHGQNDWMDTPDGLSSA